MNKHCWRIIFNPARNMLMVVADIARAPHGGPGRGSVASRRCLPRLKGLCFSLWLALGAVYPACAEVVADRTAPGRQQPTVISSADGTPQVNIQTPGRGGVSRNVYSRFDVDKKGLILNNSHAHTATQLGGMVSANPWLAKGEARVILNEVNARDPSRLNGFIEVAGRQAQVVIASPAGITCDGCGFINTSRATLTTGQVLLNDSGIAGYRTGAGTVAVTGAGMDSTQANHTDIIARAVQVNAGIWARELRITGGASETDAAHDTVSPGTQAAAGRPDFGVDVSQLGGMYAGKIRLSGTERGVGVRNAGHIGAQAGTVVVGVDGRIDNSGQIVAQGGMDLAARGTLDNSGAVHGGGSVTVTAVGALHNSGFLASAQHTTLRADSVTVTGEGTLAAGLGSDGRFADTGDLTVTSQGALIAGGQSRAAGEIQLTGSGIDIRGSRSHGRDIILNARGGEVVTAQAAVSAQQRLTIREAAVLDNRGGSLSGDQLQVDAGRLVNGQGQMVQRGGQDQTFTLRDGLDNRGGVISSNARQWRIDTTQLDNTGGQLLHDGGQFTLAATRLWDDGGDIVSRGGLSLSAGQLQMNDSRTQAQALSVTGDSLAHRNGRMFQSGSGMMSLTLTGALDNQGGQIVASQGDLTFRGVQVDNRQGWLAAGGAFLATSSALDNSGGLLQAGAGLTLDTRGRQLINRHSGEQGGIISGGGLTLRSGELDNAQGVIAGGRDVRLTTLAFSNQQGALRAGADLSVATQQQALDNRRGTLQGAGKIRLDTGQLDNRDGSVTGGALDIDAGSALLSQVGELLSPGDIRISAAQTDNTGGLIRSGKTLAVTTDALLNGDTHRAGKGMEGDRVSVTAQRLDNRQGAIRAGQQLALAVSSTLDNTRGLLSAEQQLAVDGGSTLAFTASGGTVVADRESRIAARAMSGDGDILSGGALALSLSETFSHQGRIVAGGDADIRIQGGVNNRGQILAGGALTLNAAELTNQAGGEISATENHLLIGGTLLNDGLLDGGLTHIVSGTLINGPGGRLYGDHIAIATGLLENAGNGESAPVIAARERLDIGAQRLNNRRHGLIYSTGGLAIGGALDAGYHASGRAQSVDNHSARIEAGDSLWLNTATLNNINDRFATTTATTSVSQHHEMTFQGATERYDWADVDLSERDKYGVRRARTADGKSGQEFYEYNYTRTVRETQVTDSDPGQIIAGGGMTVDADRATNRDSQVVSGGTLITRVGVLDNQGTTGERITTEEGRQTRWYPKKTKRTIGGTKTSQGRRSSDWRPAPRTQTIDLGVQAWQGNARITGSGTEIAGRSAAQPGSQSEARGAGMAAAVTVVPLRVAGGQAADREVRVMMPDFRLPDSRLFTLSPDSTAGYLTQTDPRFTRARQWLGSDYMMNQLTGSPDGLLKRLGDGYYEQKLVRDQIMNLTGQRFLDGFSSDEAQYRQLMDNGVTLARQYNLSPGVALTAEQMALLTADMVWLVRQTVTLPDGSTRDVLAPQVYARVRPGDVDGGGALLAGRSIAMNLTGALNNSGVIAGRERVQISAQEVTNRGRMDAGRLELSARQDITNTGGVLTGRDGVSLLAGRDILSRSTLSANADGEYADRLAGIFVQNAGGKMTLAALNDIRLDASQLSGQGDVLLQAGHDLTLGTLTQTHSEHSRFGKNNWRTLTRYQDSGSTLSAAGDLTLLAGNQLTATAATLSADKALTLQSGGDMAISAGRGGYHLTEHSRQASKGLLSGRSSERHDEVIINRAHGASLGGDSITLISGHDLTISGSSVAGTRDVALQAGRNLTVTTAAESVDEIHWRKEQKTGLSGTGGIGFSYGSQQIRVTDSADTLGGRGSIVGSSQGRLTLSAGNRLDVQGSELIAGRDMALVGREVAITDARESSVQRHQVEQKSSGFTLALSGAAGSALNTAVQTAQSAREENDSRLSALTATKAALSGVQAAQALRLDNAQGEAGGGNNTVGISLSYGSQSSTSTQTQTRSQAQGSALIAGNNLSITATGGDVTVQGSQLQAGRDMLLSAERDVNLLSAQNTQRLEGKNDSRGGSVGVGIGVGSGGWGISVSASMNQGKGSERGNGTTHSETMLNAGRQVTIISGRDTTLSGAQVSGETVKARVGRNLTLASQQDSSRYDMKQQNASAGGSFTFGSMSGSGSVSLSRDKMHSNYDSVVEQTGIFAGRGGFDITVGGHTQLAGAAIGSTAAPERNRLETGTLGFGDIGNRADYKVEHQSSGFSSGGPVGSQFAGNMANTLLVGVNREGHDSSVTRSAVSAGTIVVRDRERQQQDVSTLSRDVAQANQSLSPIFDKEKEQKRLQQAQLIGDISSQVMDAVRTEAAIAASAQANEDIRKATPAQRAEARAAWEAANPGKSAGDGDIDRVLFSRAYDEAMRNSASGTGGKYQQAMQAATAAVQGLAGGDLKAALAGGAAPYLAEVIKNSTTSDSERVMAHAVVNAALAKAQGHNALAGAAGAATGELVGIIAGEVYGRTASELSETEKQTVSALATLASGLAGGLTGDSTAEAVSAAQAGKTTVENNALNPIDFGKGMADISLSQQTLGVDMIKNGASPDELTEALIKNSQGQIPDGQNAAKGLIIAWAEFFGVPVSALTADGEMTPQRATEIVASGVPTSEAKLMQYVVAKAFLAVTKNTTVKAETGSSIIYHENFGGHTIQKHVGKSDAQLLARFENEPNLSASSTFFNQTAADKAIGNGIAANKGQLAEWLAGDQSRLILQHTEKFTVGKVIQKSDGSSYFSKKITIVIDRDPAMPNGYRVHTAYPK